MSGNSEDTRGMIVQRDGRECLIPANEVRIKDSIRAPGDQHYHRLIVGFSPVRWRDAPEGGRYRFALRFWLKKDGKAHPLPDDVYPFAAVLQHMTPVDPGEMHLAHPLLKRPVSRFESDESIPRLEGVENGPDGFYVLPATTTKVGDHLASRC